MATLYKNRLNANCGCTNTNTKATKPDTEKKPVTDPVDIVQPISPHCKTFRVETITRVGDEVLIMLNDCTYLTAPVTVVDKSLSESLAEDDKQKIKQLEETINKLTGSLVDIQEFDGDVSYKAISKDFQP